MNPRLTAALTLILPLVLLTVACAGGGSGAPASDVVAAIPWSQRETLAYVLKDKAGSEQGKATLSVEVAGARTTLAQRFTSASSSDESEVVVDSATLKPVSATRAITSPKDKTNLTVTYSPDGVLIKQDDRQSGLSVPDHSYDNDTSLFLWRTIPFQDGYTATYTTIITNRRSRQTVGLKVTGKESVTVPAGQFQAWRLEIRTESAKQVAWFADTPARILVKYDNSLGTFFELETRP